MQDIDDGYHPEEEDYPLFLTVDGQQFTITFRSPGKFSYAWNNAPTPGCGYNSSINNAHSAPHKYLYPTIARHEESIKSYLEGVDPATGL